MDLGQFLHQSVRGTLVWQWVAVPALAPVAWLVGRVLGRLARVLVLRVTRRTEAKWDDVLVERLSTPTSCALGIAAYRSMLPLIRLGRDAEGLIQGWLRTGFFAALLLGMIRLVDVLATAVSGAPWARSHSGSRSLISLASRTAKVVVVLVAAVAMLSELGYPIASLLAGLGIGGLALALAAQKTVENLFGAFSIGFDQPIREGDFVKIDDFVGTVEVIGLRSTRVRTLDRTLISIPNGRLAEMRLESFSARDRIRLATTVSLVYSTTSAQMRSVLAGLEGVLRDQPKIWPEAVVVRFKELSASSLDVEVMAWFQTADWSEFQLIRQEVLIAFLDVVERAGSSFAFPTQTVHVESA